MRLNDFWPTYSCWALKFGQIFSCHHFISLWFEILTWILVWVYNHKLQINFEIHLLFLAYYWGNKKRVKHLRTSLIFTVGTDTSSWIHVSSLNLCFVKVEESDDFTLKYLSGTNYRKLKGTMTKPNCYIKISEYHIFTLRYLRKSLIIVHDTVVSTYKMGSLSWRGEISSILLSQWIWNLAW